MREISLPVIDLSVSRLSDSAARKEETDKLIDSFSSAGFCIVTGIEGYDADKLLKWVKWFFLEVPEDERMNQLATKTFVKEHHNLYRGYFPVVPGNLSHKHGYDIGPSIDKSAIPKGEEDNPFYQDTPILNLPGREDQLKEFYQVMYHHQRLTHATADQIMSLLAEAGGKSSDFFAPMFSKLPLHTFRPLRYPKRTEDIPKGAFLDDGRIISTPAHMDSGFLTLLQTFDFSGLEIEVDGEWFSVPSKKDALVVNLGEQMTAMSNGRFKSTIHRVIDIGEDRYSVPFFYEPSCDANIKTKLPQALLPAGDYSHMEPEELKRLSFYPFGAFLLNKLPIYAEYAALAENLPDWCRKKYLDQYEKLTCWAAREGIEVDGKMANQA